MYSLEKLGLARVMFAESVLFVGKAIIMIKVFHNVAIQDTLKYLTTYGCKRDRLVVTMCRSISFFEDRIYVGNKPV